MRRFESLISMPGAGLEAFCDEEQQVCFVLNANGKVEPGEPFFGDAP